MKFPAQQGNQGLGHGNFNPNPTQAERRKLISAKASAFCQENYLAHSISLKQQSVWVQWSEIARPFDFSWQNLIWGDLSSEVIKFVLAASVNWVRTPDLMHLWGYKESSVCCLCGAPQCTLHHILSNCSFALNQKRYTWRHDSILNVIQDLLKEHVQSRNQKQQQLPKPSLINFVKAGSCKITSQKKKSENHSDLLASANDWKLLTDLPGNNYVFPPEIFPTQERPDIVIWSIKSKRVLLIELTCPAEEGIQAAKIHKETKYQGLLENISRTTPWIPSLYTIEVGVRGFIAISSQQVFSKLGICGQRLSAFLKKLSSISATCSFTIFKSSSSGLRILGQG